MFCLSDIKNTLFYQMLPCHHHLRRYILSPSSIFPLSHHHINHHRYLLSLQKPTNHFSLKSLPSPKLNTSCLSQLPDRTTTTTENIVTITTPDGNEGPLELPPSSPSIFATSDDPSSIQVATSILLTGAVSVFLFRALRRRAKRAKELKFRSSGAKKTLKEEAIDSLKAMGSTTIDAKKPPSPVQALLGGISAGVIALILYKFTTTIEAALNRQTMSDNFSVRQITITIRTIVNGLCYLATFVFGFNSVGLFLYSGQLALNSLMGDLASEETENKSSDQSGSQTVTTENPADSPELSSSQIDQNQDSKQ